MFRMIHLALAHVHGLFLTLTLILCPYMVVILVGSWWVVQIQRCTRIWKYKEALVDSSFEIMFWEGLSFRFHFWAHSCLVLDANNLIDWGTRWACQYPADESLFVFGLVTGKLLGDLSAEPGNACEWPVHLGLYRHLINNIVNRWACQYPADESLFVFGLVTGKLLGDLSAEPGNACEWPVHLGLYRHLINNIVNHHEL